MDSTYPSHQGFPAYFLGHFTSPVPVNVLALPEALSFVVPVVNDP